MSDAATNKAVLRKAYQRWHETRGGSIDDWFALSADNIRFGSLAEGATPKVAFTERVTGREQLRGYFLRLVGDWSMQHYTVDALIAEDDRVVMVGSTAWMNKSTGKVAETRKVDVWRFKDGKAVDFYEYYDTANLIAAATP